MPKPGFRNKVIDKIDNVYRRINKRMEELFNAFGENSSAYQEYASTVSHNFQVNTRGTGLVQIKRGKSNAMSNDFQQRAIDKLLKSGETLGSMKAAAYEDLQRTKGENYIPSTLELLEHSKKVDYVKGHKDQISYISDQIKSGIPLTAGQQTLYNRAAGRSDEMSYDELYEMIQVVENGG